jgi:hypothetical protein
MSSDPVTDQVPESYSVAAEPAGEATDEATLTTVLASYESAGFDAQFAATDEGQVHCYSCASNTAPERVELHSLRRLEGASDPADMLAVAAISCPACAAKGVLVLNYGPDTTPGESEVLIGLEDRRHDDVLPSSQTPDEAAEG